MSRTSDIELLTARFHAHIRAFPKPQTDDPQILSLRAELATYDAEIAGLLSWVVRGEKFSKRYPRERKLGQRIRSLLELKPHHSELLLAYQRIYNELQEMIDLAESIAKKR